MNISSVDNTCWVKLESKSEFDGYSGFQVEAHVDIDHGQFDAKNIHVQFLNLEEFAVEFDRFITDRSRTPRLEGTYDTYIAFSTSGTAVMVQYGLGDAFCGGKTVCFHQSGAFEIDQERLLQYLAGFQILIEAQPDDPAEQRA